MYFMIYAKDDPAKKAMRDRVRGEHRRFVRARNDSQVTIHAAGPFFEEDGKTMVGSLWLVEAENIDVVRNLVEKIPYHAAGLYEHVEIRPYGWSLGPPSSKR